jgi:hypothetical protein
VIKLSPEGLKSQWQHLGIPDGAERGDPSANHAVNNLLGQRLVGDNDHGLSIEFLHKAIRQFNHVRFTVFAGVYRTIVRKNVCRRER